MNKSNHSGLTILIAVAVILVGVVATAIFLLTRGGFGPAPNAARIAGEIADFTVPDGYTNALATQLADFEVVGYDGPDGHSHLYLLQLPPGLRVDQADLESRLQESTGDQPGDYGFSMQVIAQQAVTIRGQSTTLVVTEGINGSGQSIRSANAAFEGKDGQALLSFSGLSASWDAAMIDAFMSSMR
jgi:hypothetical protein